MLRTDGTYHVRVGANDGYGGGEPYYLRLFQTGWDGRRSIATDITLTGIESGDLLPSPLLFLEKSEVQSLLDTLWSCGIRPSHHSYPEGEMARLEQHLAEAKLDAMRLDTARTEHISDLRKIKGGKQ